VLTRRTSIIAAATAILLNISCAGSLFKVKPAIELPPLKSDATSVTGGGVTVRVAPLLTDEESQDLFEANLPLSGVLAVRTEITYDSGVPVETKNLRFHVRDTSGREWKLTTAKAAVSRILKANDIYAYNPNSRKQFEKEFGAYGIDLKTPLSNSNRTSQGFLFFQTPKNEPVPSTGGLVLTIERLPQPVEIKLN
jgi:hypothetical protein